MTEEILPQAVPQAHAAESPDPMLNMIATALDNKDCDIHKLERLIEMRNNELARCGKAQFNKSFAKMQEKLPRVVALHKNGHTNSSYAKIEDINQVILPVLCDFGFAVSFQIKEQTNNSICITASLLHEKGHTSTTTLQMPLDLSGKKQAIHASASTITYAKRYALCMLLNISTGDDDDGNGSFKNNNAPLKKISPEQVLTLENLMILKKIDKQKVLDHYNRKSTADFNTNEYQKAVYQLQKK